MLKLLQEAIEFTLKNPLVVWSAVLSSVLGFIKVWETFWKNRPKLAATYSLTGDRYGSHEITIANLSALPVLVSSWELAWEPRWSSFWLKHIDVTPDETFNFKIDRYSTHSFKFSNRERFAWGWRVASGRQLVMRLRLFGKRRRLKLVIGSGQAPAWLIDLRVFLRKNFRRSDINEN